MKIDLSQHKKSEPKSSPNFDLSGNLPSFKKFSNKQKEDFYREFSTLIKSGVDYNQALKILAGQQKSKFVKAIYEQINDAVVKGKPLHEAIKDHKYFTPYEYIQYKNWRRHTTFA